MATWNPFWDVDELRREFDRAFDSVVSSRRSDVRRAAFLPGFGGRDYPLVNIHEDKDTVYVEALAPGVDPASLDLNVQGTTLTISGEKVASPNTEGDTCHRSERSSGKFTRSVDLPYAVDDSRVEATYQNGLLLVTLPKHENAKPKTIAVKLA